jgi:hypothetical protein
MTVIVWSDAILEMHQHMVDSQDLNSITGGKNFAGSFQTSESLSSMVVA